MEITTLSGATVTQLHEEELGCMVKSGSSVRDLKKLLANRLGYSRFRQRLLGEDMGELQDDMPLRQRYSCVQLVVLDFCSPDETAWKALLLACDTNQVVEVEELLQKPLDLNRIPAEADPSSLSKSPMNVAAERGHLGVVQLLLEAGADKDAAKADGVTALMAAALKGHLEVVRLLLEAGADKNVARADGATALMGAAQNGCLEVVRLLLEAGADKNAGPAGWENCLDACSMQ